jgi:hypothetical protein
VITIFAVIIFGGIVLVGVIFLILGFSSPKKHQQQLTKGEMAMVVSQSNKNFDLVTLPGGMVLQIPKENKFDPNLVMMQLAEIQHAPNLVSAYARQLTARFRANREIRFIRKIEEYQLALAAGIASQVKMVEQQLELARKEFDLKVFIDPGNRALAEEVYRGNLEEKRAKQKANTSRYQTIQKQQSSNNSYDKSVNQVKRQIDTARGRQDAIMELEREKDGKRQYILRGRDERDVSPFEREELVKIERYYGNIMDQL